MFLSCEKAWLKEGDIQYGCALQTCIFYQPVNTLNVVFFLHALSIRQYQIYLMVISLPDWICPTFIQLVQATTVRKSPVDPLSDSHCIL